MKTFLLLILFSLPTFAQSLEKIQLTLGAPIYNTNQQTGYYYEARGNVYESEFAFACDSQIKNRIGLYRIGVTLGNEAEHIATYYVKLLDGRQLLWQGYFKLEDSWSYEGIVLHSETQIVTDYKPLSTNCFGGKLTVYFLN